MVVFTAIWIEEGVAFWTLIPRSHIFFYCQFGFTVSAENSFGVPLIFVPCLCGMTRCFPVTLVAGVVFVTTFELDSNNIKR